MTTTKPTKAKPAKRTAPKPPPDEPAPLEPLPASSQEPLPGLEDVTARGSDVSYLERGVRRTIAALYLMGTVQELHAAHTAAAVELAQIIDAKKTSGRMSTVGNDMRAMIELLDRIVPEKSEMDETLKAAMDEWTAAHETAGPWVPTPP